MRIEGKQPFSLGFTSVIMIITAVAISSITVLLIATAYRVQQDNEAYVAHTQAYYVADGEATIKRALIEEALSEVYHSKENIVYDVKHIKRALYDIKDIELKDIGTDMVEISYEEPINKKEILKIELQAKSIKEDKRKTHLTQVKRWEIIKK